MLAGFKTNNHPQQVKTRGAVDEVDQRITPDWLFRDYHARFNFTIDVAANAANRKLDRHYDLAANGLRQPWAPERVWCNPPYSNVPAWIFKAHQEFERGCPVIVMLLPSNRTEQKWWQQFVEPHRDRAAGFMRTEFLSKRINFGAPGNESATYNSSPPFGLVAVIFEKPSN